MKAMQKSAGFTLFEVIVVLVITSLISVVLIQGLGLVLSVRTGVANKIVDIDQVVMKRNLVLEPLRGIVPDYNEKPYVFKGTPRKVHALTVRTLLERTGTPTGFDLSLDYNSGRGETVVLYKEEGQEPIELTSWKGNTGAFSYRDRGGAWSEIWPTDDKSTQTPWVVRLVMTDDESSTLVASIAGAHRRILRVQDMPVDRMPD